MLKPLTALLLASALLAGCGAIRDSRVNPFNWFGGSREVVTEDAGPVNPLLPPRNRFTERPEAVYRGVPVDVVSDLQVDRTLSGAIIRATGVARQQGGFDLRLTPVSEDGKAVDGVLAYTFDVVYPNRPQPVGTERSRTLIAATSVTHEDLEGVRVIRVIGAQNARESRRR